MDTLDLLRGSIVVLGAGEDATFRVQSNVIVIVVLMINGKNE